MSAVLGRLSILLSALWIIALAGSSAAPASSPPPLPSQDPFYSYSGSLAGVAPGTVLRSRSVTLSTAQPFSATQVLYRTTGELGQPTVTVATVIRSLVPSLPAATKIVSYQTAYDALGTECDPSYTLRGGNPGYSTAAAEEQLIGAYATAGDTVVVPDYEGVHLDWGAGQESGYGTLDGIRAAEKLLALPAASTPVGMVGYSGGSIATEFASELAPRYAPGLDIVGVAEGGVPVDFAHNLAYINGSPDWSGVIPAVLVGIGRAYGINIATYESPYGLKVAAQVNDECINNFLGSYPGLTIQKLVKPQYANFFGVPLFARINNQLIMSRTGTPRGPLFIGVGNKDGTGDGVMIAKDVEALAHTYCRRGVSVQFNEYKNDDHTAAAIPFEVAAMSFLGSRLIGVPASNGCSSVAAGNSLAPLPVKTSTPVRLKLRLIGPRRRLHGVLLALFTNHGTLRGLTVRLRRGHRVLTKLGVSRVTSRGRRVVLRVHGRMPPPGRYALSISHGRRVLIGRRLRIR